MGSDDEFPSASSVTVVARLSSCRAASRSPPPPLFSRTQFFSFDNIVSDCLYIRKGLHKFSTVRKEIHWTCPSEIATVQKLGFGIM